MVLKSRQGKKAVVSLRQAWHNTEYVASSPCFSYYTAFSTCILHLSAVCSDYSFLFDFLTCKFVLTTEQVVLLPIRSALYTT